MQRSFSNGVDLPDDVRVSRVNATVAAATGSFAEAHEEGAGID